MKIFLTIALAVLFTACGVNETVLRDGKPDPNATPFPSPKAGVDADVEAVTTAGYKHVYVIRRKDGGKLSTDDRKSLRLLTQDAVRRIVSDDETVLTVGTEVVLKDLAKLANQYAVETKSRPEDIGAIGSNTNSNSAQNTNK